MKVIKSRAAVLSGFNESLRIQDIFVQPPGKDEVRVKIAASGVCQSDVSGIKGLYGSPLPAIVGHEGAGVVLDVGEGVSNVRPGDHVVLSWKPQCRECHNCRRGRSHLCDGSTWSAAGLMKDGTPRYHDADGNVVFQYGATSTFAEYTVVDKTCAVSVPKDLPLEEVALIGCAVTTGLGAVLERCDVTRDDIVCVIGCGGVGMSAIQGAKIANAKEIIAVDQNDETLRIAMELGATSVINSQKTDARTEILSRHPYGVDYAFEAVGIPATISLAQEVLGKGGRTVLIGVSKREDSFAISPFDLVRSERAVMGSYYGSCCPAHSFIRYTDLLGKGEINLSRLVRRYPLEEVNTALRDATTGLPGRGVIVL